MLVPDGRELDLYEVFLWSGNFVPIKTDLYVLDLIDSRGETTEYEYNLFSHIARMTDSRGSNSLEISYDPHDRDNKVIQLSLPDGSKFQIDYFLDKETGGGHVDITDPKREITRVTMDPKPGENDPFYTVEKLARNSSLEHQR